MHAHPPQQRTGHPVAKAGPRLAGARCALGLGLVLIAGCGEVHFVPSPYTPQQVELIYSAQEHITVMRWRVSAAAPPEGTHFELLGPDGYQPVDFSQSVFTGGVNACGDKLGSCAQYIVRGKYTVDDGARPIRTVHELYGVLPGGFPTKKTVSETFSFQSFFRPKNDMVFLNISDTVARSGPYVFPRSYEHTMWPTTGLCVSDVAPDDVSFSTLDATGGFPPPLPLTDRGMYCVAARPKPSDDGDAALVEARIATLPEVITARQVFDPPVERSPIIYQLVLDLEIPVPDRCADVIQKVEDLTKKYLTAGGVPVYKLPTINLAEDASSRCAQTNGRTVAAVDMADAVKQLVQTLPGYHQQYHLMYFNNLDAPIPSPFVTSWQSLLVALANSPPNHELQPFPWIFNPGIGELSTQGSLSWWAFWQWKTADDMFEMQLDDYQRKSLPYTTQFHDPNEPVPLLSAADVTAYENAYVKICLSSPAVAPIGKLPYPHLINDPSWQITAADPPAYLVTLNNQVVIAAQQFVEQSAIVTYQICTRYCDDHPYVTDSGQGEVSWRPSASCTSKDY